MCQISCGLRDDVLTKSIDALKNQLDTIITGKNSLLGNQINRYNSLIREIEEIFRPVKECFIRSDSENYKRYDINYISRFKKIVLQIPQLRKIDKQDFYLSPDEMIPENLSEIIANLTKLKDEAKKYEEFNPLERADILRQIVFNLVNDFFTDKKVKFVFIGNTNSPSYRIKMKCQNSINERIDRIIGCTEDKYATIPSNQMSLTVDRLKKYIGSTLESAKNQIRNYPNEKVVERVLIGKLKELDAIIDGTSIQELVEQVVPEVRASDSMLQTEQGVLFQEEANK